MSSASAAFLDVDNEPETSFEEQLLGDLKDVLRQQYHNTPRHLQRRIGPSEIGHPCTRQLAGKLLQLDPINPDGDPLPSWLGTAGHSRFELAVELDNENLIDAHFVDKSQRCTWVRGVNGDHDYPNGRMPAGRWLYERRVTVRDGLTGTADLYDTWTNTVVDLKFPGKTTFDHYRKNGPSPEYRVQGHAYGRGYRNEGFPVERIAIWFLPRSGRLVDSFVWSEAYNDAIVDAILARLDNITLALDALDIDEHPERLNLLPKKPHDCLYCPFYSTRYRDTRPGACPGGREA